MNLILFGTSVIILVLGIVFQAADLNVAGLLFLESMLNTILFIIESICPGTISGKIAFAICVGIPMILLSVVAIDEW